MNVRTYAKVVGVVIVLIGVGGQILGDKSLLGVLNIDIAEDIVHLVTGGLMAAVGFRGSDSAVRSVVGGLGIVYLVVGVFWASSCRACSGCLASTRPCSTTSST